MNYCPICNSPKFSVPLSGSHGSGSGISQSSNNFTCLNCYTFFTKTEIRKNNKLVKITYDIHYSDIKRIRKIKLEKIKEI